MEKYSEKLQKILASSGWSQETLAKKLDVSFVSLNSWINQKSEPREKAKEKIDLLFIEILGSDDVDREELKTLKSLAEKKKCSVKKILDDPVFLERITTNLTYHTNATEGSTMTEKDVAEVIYDHKILRNRTSVEQREAINHQTALYFLLDELNAEKSNFRFSTDLILATHLRLMNGIISNAGHFRTENVRIRGAFIPLANFIKIPELIKAWTNQVNEETSDPINLLASSHASFEKIHPFSDGNGRTGRLLLFILALKLGLTPPIIEKDRKSAYYKYLELAQTKEITDPLEMFLAEEILKTADFFSSALQSL